MVQTQFPKARVRKLPLAVDEEEAEMFVGDGQEQRSIKDKLVELLDEVDREDTRRILKSRTDGNVLG